MGKELASKSAADIVLKRGLRDAPPFLSSPSSNQWAFMRCVFRGEDPLHMRVESREAFFIVEKGKKGIVEREITQEEEGKIRDIVHTLNPLVDPSKVSTGIALQMLQSHNEQLIPESINTPPTEEGDGEKGDMIGGPDTEIDGMERRENLDSLTKDVRRAVDSLPTVQSRVVKSRWGLDGTDSKTLQDVATEFEQTRQNIEQAEKRGFRRIKNRNRHFEDYIRE